jgi:hypothetical protein
VKRSENWLSWHRRTTAVSVEYSSLWYPYNGCFTRGPGCAVLRHCPTERGPSRLVWPPEALLRLVDNETLRAERDGLHQLHSSTEGVCWRGYLRSGSGWCDWLSDAGVLALHLGNLSWATCRLRARRREGAGRVSRPVWIEPISVVCRGRSSQASALRRRTIPSVMISFNG